MIPHVYILKHTKRNKNAERKQVGYEPRDKNWVKKVSNVVRDGNEILVLQCIPKSKHNAIYMKLPQCYKSMLPQFSKKKILQYKLHKNALQGSLIALSIVQSLSGVWLFVTPWTTVYQVSLSFTISQNLVKFMFVEWVTPSNHLLCHPLLLLPLIFLSQHEGLFQKVSSLQQVAKVLALQLQLSVLPINSQDGFPLGLTGFISLLSKVLSRVSALQFKSINSSALSLLYGPTLTSTPDLEKPQLWLYRPLSAKWCLCFFICSLGGS